MDQLIMIEIGQNAQDKIFENFDVLGTASKGISRGPTIEDAYPSHATLPSRNVGDEYLSLSALPLSILG